MADLNLFDGLSEDIRAIFNSNNVSGEQLVEFCNQKNENMSLDEFSKTIKFNMTDSKRILDTIAVICHWNQSHKREFDKQLQTTLLDAQLQNKLKNFLTNLSDEGKTNLIIRYYINKTNFDDSSLTDLTQNTFLKEIYDEDKNLVRYFPIIRLKFSFEREGKPSIRYGYFSQESLKILIDNLEKIYEESSASIKKYRNLKDSNIPIVGETK